MTDEIDLFNEASVAAHQAAADALAEATGKTATLDQIAKVLAVGLGDCFGMLAASGATEGQFTDINAMVKTSATGAFSQMIRQTCEGEG